MREQGNVGKILKGTREHEPIFREQWNKTLQIRGRKHFSVYFSDLIYGHLCITVIGFVYFTQELKQSQGSQLGGITELWPFVWTSTCE